MHTHPHAHYSSQGVGSDLLELKNERKKLHVETLEKTYTVHNIPDRGGITNRRVHMVSVHRLCLMCLFCMCSYSTAQCMDTQSFWGRLLKLKNKPFLIFFVLLNCFYTFFFFFIFFHTNVWHSKKTEHRYYMSICSNEVEMVIKNNGW